jgi:hypothetical protein
LDTNEKGLNRRNPWSVESADIQVVVLPYDVAEVTHSFFSELEKEPLIGVGCALIFEEINEVRQDFDIVEYLVAENLYVCSLVISDILHAFNSAIKVRLLMFNRMRHIAPKQCVRDISEKFICRFVHENVQLQGECDS